MPLRRKSKIKFEPWMANGHPVDGLSAKLKFAIAVGVVHYGLTVTATYDGVHTPNSWHYHKRAVDFGGPLDKMPAFTRWLIRKHKDALEIFGLGNKWMKNGVVYYGASPDTPNHVHFAV